MGGQEQPVPLLGMKTNALPRADSADGGQGEGRLQRLGEGGWGGDVSKVEPRTCLSSAFSLHTIQFSSVAQSCLTLCNSMDCSTPGLPVHHQLLEFTQTHVH